MMSSVLPLSFVRDPLSPPCGPKSLWFNRLWSDETETPYKRIAVSPDFRVDILESDKDASPIEFLPDTAFAILFVQPVVVLNKNLRPTPTIHQFLENVRASSDLAAQQIELWSDGSYRPFSFIAIEQSTRTHGLAAIAPGSCAILQSSEPENAKSKIIRDEHSVREITIFSRSESVVVNPPILFRPHVKVECQI